MNAHKDIAMPSEASSDQRGRQKLDRETVNTLVVFGLSIVLIVCSRFISPALGSWSQVLTVLILASFLIILSFGQGLVILIGGLDLSIPALITLGGVLTTTWVGTSDAGVWYMLPAILAICALVGAVSGIGIVWLKVPPFIMTMATSIVVASVALGYTSGTPRGGSPSALLWLMKAWFLGVPVVIYFTLAFILFGWLLQNFTALGRRLRALGTNRNAALIAGVSVNRLELVPYAVSAACAGFVGMMLVGYSNGATLRMGDSYMLPSIAAVVIGGSSILGGSGTFIGTVGGAILLTTLGTMISAIGLSEGWRTIIEGGIIVGALLVLRGEFLTHIGNRMLTRGK
ncbi:Monosaccharide ABC transporter membrane protein, CUT2 family [Mesorhizobium plurifarium]|uniref:Autoinducer 2 import system permease protein LsrD n=1 Tax=Mesorhizobium plurifarium TaxID=69974 RepID=A0A090DGP4_MESPL|nr:Monosaccharide ABC transporter membrane protein, CUT2 family [Mesorhizobium plurifarium]